MDRQTVYYGQIPLETDQLKQSQNSMVALAKLAAAVLGTSSVVNGFAVTPTSPASLNIIVGAGEIYQIENLEQSIWSSLPADTHSILKQGIVLDPATIGIAPPATTGYSQIFMVEVQYQDVDSGSTVLPYFNAANPAVPFSGPGNAGTAQNTVRKGVAAIQVKAGTAAPTGTQVAPTADLGWTGVCLITVANGASTITSGNITAVSAYRPFINTRLPDVPSASQSGAWTYARDTGSVNAVAVTLAPAVSAPVEGMEITVKIANANTGATTLNLNGTGNVAVVHFDGSPLIPNDLSAGALAGFGFDGTNWQLIWSQRQPNAPVFLTAAQTYYVNATTGSDGNDGLTATVTGGHGPWATLQHASDIINKFNLNGFNITVNVADGSYASMHAPAPGGSGTVFWVGDSSNPGNVIVSGSSRTAVLIAGGTHNFNGFKCVTSGSTGTFGERLSGFGISGSGTNVELQNIAFGTILGACIDIGAGPTCFLTGGFSLSGSIGGGGAVPGAFVYAVNGAQVSVDSATLPTLTISAAITFTAFVYAAMQAGVTLLFSAISGGGSVSSGAKFNVSNNAVINTSGSGASYYPGASAGTNSNGLYV